ncbi:hypothetical protein CMEL01_12718 [Colletotrichum melonis]|uniref:Uncharacterized protein n=1 Tax=Colletotrichum melonis TaxID=1209925 RepID=A0AAI9UVR9_9PEZI|nr:hypothetical protein CMEL01_12718 [Colletotrichum melonis]
MRPSDVNPQSAWIVSRGFDITCRNDTAPLPPTVIQEVGSVMRQYIGPREAAVSCVNRLSARFSQLSSGPPQTRSLVLACGVHPPSKIESDSRLVLQWEKKYWASIVMALRPRSLASSASNPRSRKRARGCTSVWYIWQPYTHCQENTSGIGSIFTNVLDRELRPMDRFPSHTSKFILASPDPGRK